MVRYQYTIRIFFSLHPHQISLIFVSLLFWTFIIISILLFCSFLYSEDKNFTASHNVCFYSYFDVNNRLLIWEFKIYHIRKIKN